MGGRSGRAEEEEEQEEGGGQDPGLDGSGLTKSILISP